ncbi:MAG: His/Gly/Thr/Pro-type tRNA ligase C-terminal domain-containing protein, partial [Planctomycetota bacterium]
LIEHFAGAFPAWLSPEQVRVLPISEKSNDYAAEVYTALNETGIRVTRDESDERIQAKIKVGAEEKVPYLLVVGPRDAEKREVSVRALGTEENLGAMPLDEFVRRMAAEVADRGATTARSFFDS